MRRITADAISGLTSAILATTAFVLWRDGSAHWASALPGHLMGTVGILLMLWAGFGYTWRKRRPAPGGAAMRTAMRTHIIAGIVGPYLVVLHSGLAFSGLAGVLTLLMVLVVASGVVGRAVISAVPARIELADPIRSAMLDAELARLETQEADRVRDGDVDATQRQTLRMEIISVKHEQEALRTQWRQHGGGVALRRVLSIWWLLHIPVSAAMWVLAVAHVAATLYYATFSR
ncbi:MAG: hypothetical protein ABMA00_04875 [Gemmatimonas sp.]